MARRSKTVKHNYGVVDFRTLSFRYADNHEKAQPPVDPPAEDPPADPGSSDPKAWWMLEAVIPRMLSYLQADNHVGTSVTNVLVKRNTSLSIIPNQKLRPHWGLNLVQIFIFNSACYNRRHGY